MKPDEAFANLWRMRLKSEIDLERQRAEWVFQGIVDKGTKPETIIEAYRRYSARFTPEREQYAKRLWDWLETMDTAEAFAEQAQGAVPSTARSYEVRSGCITNVRQYNKAAKRWELCANQHEEALRVQRARAVRKELS